MCMDCPREVDQSELRQNFLKQLIVYVFGIAPADQLSGAMKTLSIAKIGKLNVDFLDILTEKLLFLLAAFIWPGAWKGNGCGN